MPLSKELLELIRQVATSLPPSALDSLIAKMEMAEGETLTENIRQSLVSLVPNPSSRYLVNDLLIALQRTEPPLSIAELSATLSAFSYSDAVFRKQNEIELVWTGPTESVPVRRTSQALMQLINEAQEELLIVSFAIYKIPEIVETLSRALQRGVKLKLIVESPDESEGKISYNALVSLNEQLIQQAQVYIWPKDKRPVDVNGKHGSLHVKCAIADNKLSLISSANLTGYAMTLNMELGVLIRNESLVSQIKGHIEELINQRILISL